jgi:penicillin-insensitive murein DD-endopeptidase
MRFAATVAIVAASAAATARPAQAAPAAATARPAPAAASAAAPTAPSPPPPAPPAVPVDPLMAAATWARQRDPAAGPARAIGGYSAGCVQGAVALPLSGPGFRVARPERHRIFGHPTLVALLRGLGLRILELGFQPLSIGDLSQARGGPAPTGHASHQTGLDVDIWFAAPVAGSALSMVDSVHGRPSSHFLPAMARTLALTAADAHVDRLFINPVLKRALCAQPGAHGEWLRKLRPWWGHADHFHVRLACPPDSPACVAQPPLPPGDGCDTLDWWFNPKAQEERTKGHDSYSAKVGASPVLPPECRALVDEPAAPQP